MVIEHGDQDGEVSHADKLQMVPAALLYGDLEGRFTDQPCHLPAGGEGPCRQS
jgi:hypothetical protein